MNNNLHNHLIHTTLTLNSSTLYTYENFQLVHQLNNLNCSEIVSQELGLINASKTLVGSIPIAAGYTVNSNLTLYFMKKVLSNSDGSNDLITIISIAHVNVNKTLILSVLKKVIDKYIDFKRDIESSDNNSTHQIKTKLGEFKLYMNQIIKYEEMNYDSNQHLYNYGAINNRETGDESDGIAGEDVISPNQLLLANEETNEVRQLMLDNINKIMNRGDKINLLVDQTDRLTSSSLMFQKRAQLIKRKIWLSKSKFMFMIVGGIAFMIYLLIGSRCGFPGFGQCLHP
mmetsp:Transcript_174/g.196  ORF Transcript_174/g.196 Transcript_174/m.196 type:complete len:286 (+) Transcript_174:46-903(+)